MPTMICNTVALRRGDEVTVIDDSMSPILVVEAQDESKHVVMAGDLS